MAQKKAFSGGHTAYTSRSLIFWPKKFHESIGEAHDCDTTPPPGRHNWLGKEIHVHTALHILYRKFSNLSHSRLSCPYLLLRNFFCLQATLRIKDDVYLLMELPEMKHWLQPNSTTRTPAIYEHRLYGHHQRTSSQQFYNKFATLQCQSPTSRHVKIGIWQICVRWWCLVFVGGVRSWCS